mgnify:CR=1 FL=1
MKKFSKKQWIKFSIAAVLYLLFTLWMQNAWLLLGLIVLVDIFLTGISLGEPGNVPRIRRYAMCWNGWMISCLHWLPSISSISLFSRITRFPVPRWRSPC